MLIFQIKRIISSEKWCNYVITFFFLFENGKNLGWSDDGKWRKKEDRLTINSYFDFVQNLPDEESSPEALAAANRRTEQFLTVLDENMKSKKPVWQVMGTEEVEQRQKRRKELLKRRDALLKQRESKDNE